MPKASLESGRYVTAAKKGAAADWAKKYNLPNMASFSTSKYEQEGANLLALEWCRRLQYFYNIYVCQSESEYDYSDDDCGSYKEPVSFTAYLDRLPARCHARTTPPLTPPLTLRP